MSENFYDFSATRENSNLIPDGEYETVIVKAERGEIVTTGTPVINLTFKIRDDVEQACKGAYIFDTIFPDKNNPEVFNQSKLYNILHNGQDERNPNVRMRFDSLDDMLQYLNGLFMRVSTSTYTPANGGEKRTQIKWNGYMPSKIKAGTLSSTPIGEDPILPDDSDMPF